MLTVSHVLIKTKEFKVYLSSTTAYVRCDVFWLGSDFIHVNPETSKSHS